MIYFYPVEWVFQGIIYLLHRIIQIQTALFQ